jgi:membrane dipeptidase
MRHMQDSPHVDQQVRQLLQDAVVVDTHGHTLDLAFASHQSLHTSLSGRTDLPRMRAGGIAAQLTACWVSGAQSLGGGYHASEHPQRALLRMIDFLLTELEGDAGAHISLAYSADDIRAARRALKVALILGIEGGDALEDGLSSLRVLHRLGLRHLCLVHEGRNLLGVGNLWWDGATWRSYDSALHGSGGLTPLGREVIGECARLGILVDVSHMVDECFWGAIDAARVMDYPVIATHAGARTVVDCSRHFDDAQLAAIADTGGLVCASPTPLCGETSSLEALLLQVDHMAKVAGIDHVGLGTDFLDQVGPADFQDIGALDKFISGLLERGYSEKDTLRIVGGNFLRVFETRSASAM